MLRFRPRYLRRYRRIAEVLVRHGFGAIVAQLGLDQALDLRRRLAPALFSVCAFVLIYRTMPRARVKWRDVWLGGLIAALIWEAGQQIFTWWVATLPTTA
jgi:YihY family inner membrane protein